MGHMGFGGGERVGVLVLEESLYRAFRGAQVVLGSVMTRMERMLGGLLVVCAGGFAGAQAPAGAPVGTNGICKDGTFTTAAVEKGACKGHKGLQSWYVAVVPSMPVPMAGTAVPSMPAPIASGSVASMPGTEVQADKKLGPAERTAAVGGGPGLVWVNSKSNVYHCDGDAFYGKTKDGAYMSEADAKAKGAHGVRGKTCGGK